jgi:hypothetical protein
VNPESFNRPSTGQFLLAIDNPPCPRFGHQRWASGAAATSLTEAQMTRSREHLAGLRRYTRLEGPGHRMQLEAPDWVNALLLDFLTLD